MGCSLLLPTHLIYQSLELINVLKIPVNAGKAHVSDFVELFEFAHDEFADAGGLDFAQAQVEEFFFDALDGAVDLLGAHGPLAQGQVHGGEQFGAFKLDAATVFFDDGREVDVRAFISGEALFARSALAAAANEVPVFRNSCLHHLGFRMAAEGAFHGAGVLN